MGFILSYFLLVKFLILNNVGISCVKSWLEFFIGSGIRSPGRSILCRLYVPVSYLVALLKATTTDSLNAAIRLALYP